MSFASNKVKIAKGEIFKGESTKDKTAKFENVKCKSAKRESIKVKAQGNVEEGIESNLTRKLSS